MLSRRHGLAGNYGWGSPTVVNGGILLGGVVLGIISYHQRETPLGTVLLGAGATIAGVALVFFLRDLLIPGSPRTSWYPV
jgi:hypothetical protein